MIVGEAWAMTKRSGTKEREKKQRERGNGNVAKSDDIFRKTKQNTRSNFF